MLKQSQLIPQSFYREDDPVEIAKELIGKIIVTESNGVRTSGMITESEAYWAPHDLASHARNFTRTPRNEMMYAAPGKAYVYICYGIHQLFNVVTGPEEVPHAVLIRAIEPIEGIEIQKKRRKFLLTKAALSSGPGSLTKCLDISMNDNGLELWNPKSRLRIENNNVKIQDNEIVSTPRIGVESSGESALLHYRFVLKTSKYLSAMSFTKKYF